MAQLITLIDGRTSVAELLTYMIGDREESQAAQIANGVLATLEILYTDGTIDRLDGL